VAARFSALVQTGPGAHPNFYTMGTGSFPGVKRPGRGFGHQSSSRAEVKERTEPVIGRTLPPPVYYIKRDSRQIKHILLVIMYSAFETAIEMICHKSVQRDQRLV
jgi:hypothetical protein